MQVSRQLSCGYDPSSHFFQLLQSIFRFRASKRKVRLKVLFVFDELDKLDAADSTRDSTQTPAAIDVILQSLKTLLTMSGVSFVFVAGKDLYDRWLNDVGTGDSVYESIFAYDKYLPCLWPNSQLLADSIVDTDPLTKPPCEACRKQFYAGAFFCERCGKYLKDPAEAREAYNSFVQFLSFRGRGIPRRMWRTIHYSVKWYNNRPVLAFNESELRQHRAYAAVWKLLNQYETELLSGITETSTASRDGSRLATYYVLIGYCAEDQLCSTRPKLLIGAKR